MATEKRIHYYHADTTALGGHVHTPIDQMVPVIAPLSLPPVGGYAAARAEKYRLEGILSFESAHTQVAGSVSRKNGAWTTLATAAVEGLNILDVITVDRIVAQIAAEHPRDGFLPKITFIGTQFENFRIAGCPVKITVDPNLLGQNLGADQFPTTAAIDDQGFLKSVADEYRDMNDPKNLPDWVKNKTIPDWVRDSYKWDNSELKERAAIRCSLVTKVEGEFPGRPFGNVLEIPEIGKVFLGEVLLDHNTYRVIAIRLELGCPTSGALSGPTASIEGDTW